MKRLSYKSHLTTEEFERMKEWNDRAHQLRQRTKPVTYKAGFLTLTAPPGIYPGNSPDSDLLAGIIDRETCRGQTFLDMGTGTGRQGIIAAWHFAQVTAVDKFLDALACAIDNARENGASSQMEFILSDGFQNLQGRKFDRIAINPPYRPFRPKDNLDAASNDEDYEFLIRFSRHAKNHLNPSGKVWLAFGTSGDVAFLEYLLKQENYHYRIVASKTSEEESWRVYRVYELTPQSWSEIWPSKLRAHWKWPLVLGLVTTTAGLIQPLRYSFLAVIGVAAALCGLFLKRDSE